MRQDDGRVPALLLCGGSRAARDVAVARLARPAVEGRSIAVLRSGGIFAGPDAALGPYVIVKRAAEGCACCTGGVLFRVALHELLRKQPSRLVVDLGPGAHVETLEKQMRSGSLGRALRVVGSVDLDAAPDGAGWPAELSGG
jgi:hypothetical protein